MSEKIESNARKIWVDTDSINDELNIMLEEILRVGADYKISRAVGPDFLSNLNKRIVNLRKRINDEFSIVIIGNFKRGKSTFINALLNQDIVPTNVTPETVTINQISYGEEFSVEAVLKDKRRVQLEKRELFRENLDQIASSLPADIDHIEIALLSEELKGIRIVDTPGLGDILKTFDQQINDYLVHADSVIYIISALSPFSEEEQTFLRACIIPQEFSKLYVAVNMMDSFDSEEDYNRLLSSIREKINNTIPEANVFGISALDEVCRQKGVGRPNKDLQPVLEGAFQDMRGSLQDNIFTQHEFLKLHRVTTLLSTAVEDFNKHLNLLKNSIQMNTDKLNELISKYQSDSSEVSERLSRFKQELSLDIQDMYTEAGKWMEEFFKRIENETISSMRNSSLEGVLKNFHFFMVDTIREAVSECINVHTKDVMTRVRDKVNEMGEEFRSNVAAGSTNTVSKGTFMDVSWTELDNAAGALTIASSFIPGFGLLAEIGQLVLGIGKGSMAAKQLNTYVDTFKSRLPEIKNNILTEMKSSYRQITEYAHKQLDEGYKQQIEASLDAVKQAQQIAQMDEQSRKESLDSMEAAEFFIDSSKKRLEDLHNKFIM